MSSQSENVILFEWKMYLEFWQRIQRNKMQKREKPNQQEETKLQLQDLQHLMLVQKQQRFLPD
jgi:hypothetical protein